MKKSVRRLAIGAVIAAAAGYVAGILTAPKSGKETRADIKKNAKQAQVEAEKELKKLHTELTAAIEQAKARIEPTAGKTREELAAAIDKAKAGKDKAREILSAVHEGETVDKDLAHAIREARAALKHLKVYLSK